MTARTARVTFAGPVPPITGGIASHSACLVRAFGELGSSVDVVSWRSQYPKLLYKGSGIDPESRADPNVRFLLRWWDPTSWVRTGRIARRGDLLVMPWVTPVHAIPQRVITAAARGVPLSLLVHNAIPHERMPFDERLARFVMRRAAKIVVHAESVAATVHDLAPDVPVAVVPHPPQLPVAVTPLPPSPPLRLLCLGFVRPYKGFDIAVEAVRVLQARNVDVRLTVAGEVWGDRDEWQTRVADPDLRGAVTLIARYLPDDEVAQLLASHHVLVAPYRSATQSGVVSLAFAAGRPVVASDVGGLRESVTDEHNGRLVAPNNAGELADAIEQVAKDVASYANAAAATRWSWEDVARELLSPVR
jgi:glycosyltransferase involved in cell wall biosynthesis